MAGLAVMLVFWDRPTNTGDAAWCLALTLALLLAQAACLLATQPYLPYEAYKNAVKPASLLLAAAAAVLNYISWAVQEGVPGAPSPQARDALALTVFAGSLALLFMLGVMFWLIMRRDVTVRHRGAAKRAGGTQPGGPTRRPSALPHLARNPVQPGLRLTPTARSLYGVVKAERRSSKVPSSLRPVQARSARKVSGPAQRNSVRSLNS